MSMDHNMRDNSASQISVRQIWIYLALTFALSWLLWLPAILDQQNAIFLNLGGGPAIVAIMMAARNRRDAARPPWLAFMVLAPILSAVLVLATFLTTGVRTSLGWNALLLLPSLISAWIFASAWSRDSGVRLLMGTLAHVTDWRWPIFAFLFFPALLLGSAAIARAAHLPVVEPARGTPMLSILGLCGVRLTQNLAFTATYEEPGWRGFLLPALQRRFSPLLASVFVWLAWAAWHAPLDFSGGIGKNLAVWIQVRIVYFFAITILLTWLYNRSRSLLTVAVFHAAMNSFPFLLPYSPPLLSVIFLLAGIAVVYGRMWRRVTPPHKAFAAGSHQ